MIYLRSFPRPKIIFYWRCPASRMLIQISIWNFSINFLLVEIEISQQWEQGRYLAYHFDLFIYLYSGYRRWADCILYFYLLRFCSCSRHHLNVFPLVHVVIACTPQLNCHVPSSLYARPYFLHAYFGCFLYCIVLNENQRFPSRIAPQYLSIANKMLEHDQHYRWKHVRKR